jgi:MarR family transcriptional regulator for hemolysin
VNPLRTFGFLLKDVTRRYVEHFEQRAKTLGVTLPQCRVLIYLASHEGMTQVQLAELTDLEPMTLVRTLDYLESQGYLERRADPTDRRARRLYLLPKGRPLVDDIWQLVDLTRRETFAGVPRKQADLMIETLEKMQSNLVSLARVPANASAAVPSGRTGAARTRRERTGAVP